MSLKMGSTGASVAEGHSCKDVSLPRKQTSSANKVPQAKSGKGMASAHNDAISVGWKNMGKGR
ncbi:MAG: hypothetical protein KJ556_20130 [Gammaproteobacteria bacterium]|nr:hypothetical protein [Gammaproteobacteria bacterium]